MKQIALLFISLAALAGLAFSQPPGTLVGRWGKKISKDVLMAVFRTDSSYEGFVNGKSFIGGKFNVRKDTLRISDGGCNLTYYGTYKVAFFDKDSVRYRVIQDTCRRRRSAYDGLTMGRIRPDQTK